MNRNKLFLFFCIFFVLEFIGLQIVGYMHITNQARLDGERIFNWQWPAKNQHCVAEIYETKILSRNNTEAVVKVLARERIVGADPVGADPVGADLVGAAVSPPAFSIPRAAKAAPTKTTAQAPALCKPRPYANSAHSESGLVGARLAEPATRRYPSLAPTKCAAVLNYYRMNNKWFLGKVEFE